jgi:CelD/BcsL family acetyltransferase involved in cellulose biosynthesis
MTPVIQAVRAPHAAARPAIRVETIDTAWGFTALRPQWNALLRTSAADGPFLTWEWLHAWWTHLATGSLSIIAVREGDELIAIAPFTVAPHALPWFSRVHLLGTGHAGSDYLDLIVRDGCEADAIRAIAGFLNTQRMTARFDHLRDASLCAQLAERLGADRWIASTAADGVCPLIPLAGHSWDSYLATLGSAHRANVRRRLRGIEQQFQVRFDLVTTEAVRAHALDALAGFHERRFKEQGGSSAFFTPAVRAFQHDATRRVLDRGWLRMYVLRLNDEIAAVMYGFLYNRQFYFYQHGFDDRYSRQSIGLVLMALTLRAAIDEGAESFDLLWGTEGYKSLWAREARTLRRIHLFPPHAAGRIHRRAVDARRRLGRLARRVLNPGEHRVPRT